MNMLAPIRAAMLTDRGLVRDHNEDYVLCREPESLDDEKEHGWLYIVADGVGGADAGEVASEFASNQVLTHYVKSGSENPGERLVDSMQAANTDLRQLVAERNQNKRMATTMVATTINETTASIANVGDSRGYHWRDSILRQITKDQSLVAKLVEEGAITEEEAASHPHRNVILYSIGSERTPQIDLFEVSLEPGDQILLCSDGLTRHVSDEEICEMLGGSELENTANQLIQLAKQRGGQDNISAAIIAYDQKQQDTVLDTVVEDEPRVAMPLTNNTTRRAPSRALLVPYTIFLSIVEAILIVLAWLWLRV